MVWFWFGFGLFWFGFFLPKLSKSWLVWFAFLKQPTQTTMNFTIGDQTNEDIFR